VILVNGAASATDAATLATLGVGGGGVQSTKVLIAGGTGVVSPGIESSLNTAFGNPQVTRLAGANRYATSVAINAHTFDSAQTVFLAVGTGYADALAGAAAAGSLSVPLFVVPGDCVPPAVLGAIEDLGAEYVFLLGGTGALSQAVFNLESC
jgi:putative cell wall-binding protein